MANVGRKIRVSSRVSVDCVGLTEKHEWIDAFEVLTVLEDRDRKSQLLTYFDAGLQSQDF